MIFEPLDFIARLAALVPKPRVNLTCFHGVCVWSGIHEVTSIQQSAPRDNNTILTK
ncbi:transposase InsA [Paraglaciecola psychrophila 170]|uniref:Transposase InsA n=1 Tax=Paraglaciecola psychrophila 170 TaxID=1129794 RepID=K7AXL3_9ALTE|nr:transposase InsA [Paraglaciecola psychrophila 170]GAC39840.1 hypothetical protein GPSY_4229 [Paraglaciecola psychrophila 170]